MKIDEVREILNERFDSVNRKAGIFTAKKSYFYGISQSGEKEADIVKNLIPNAKIIDYGNHSNHSNGSYTYFYVKFTVED